MGSASGTDGRSFSLAIRDSARRGVVARYPSRSARRRRASSAVPLAYFFEPVGARRVVAQRVEGYRKGASGGGGQWPPFPIRRVPAVPSGAGGDRSVPASGGSL